MKNIHTSNPNPPPAELVQKAMELWGREVRNLPWEKVDFGPEYRRHHGEWAFVCTKGQACEVTQMTLFQIKEKSQPVTYGIGKCLSCEIVYWGRVGD
ncbi:MAG TPA: hypothetical protein VHY08_29480 [Bacillota bacterium]|nr:hypothetical protein [Bacillota bacterium]